MRRLPPVRSCRLPACLQALAVERTPAKARSGAAASSKRRKLGALPEQAGGDEDSDDASDKVSVGRPIAGVGRLAPADWDWAGSCVPADSLAAARKAAEQNRLIEVVAMRDGG